MKHALLWFLLKNGFLRVVVHNPRKWFKNAKITYYWREKNLTSNPKICLQTNIFKTNFISKQKGKNKRNFQWFTIHEENVESTQERRSIDAFPQKVLTPLSICLFVKCHSNSRQLTVWKFHDFFVTQILREINFEDSRSSKIPVFALTFVNFLNFSLQKVQKFRPSECVKMADFALLESPKLISR